METAGGGQSSSHTFRFLRPPNRGKLEQALNGGTPLGLLWVGISGYSMMVKLYGLDIGQAVREKLENILESQCHQILRFSGFRFIEKVDGSSYMVLFQEPALSLDQLMDAAMTFRLTVRNMLNQEVLRLIGQNLSVDVGYALVSPQDDRDLESRLFGALSDARQVAEGALDFRGLSLMSEFRKILETGLLRAVYQPIVNLRNGEVLGWESLARGPEMGHFHSPKMMFDFAEEVGSIFNLERVCRERAVAGLGELAPGQKLFLNIHPQTMSDPLFKSGETRRLLEQHGLKPANVVFEITERHSIKNFALFHRTLEHYRSQGYLVAIDDVGTGYSGLTRLARVRPDFIKVDMSLVRGIDSNPVQRALLETLVTFADKIGCSIVAEGIETPTELTSLIAMGVHYGQGYHLARPDAPKPRPAAGLPFQVNAKKAVQAEWKCSIAVRELAEAAPQVGPDAWVKEVKTLLDSHPMAGVVVVEDNRPVGLVMSHSLDRQLGTYFGTALYYERGVERVMDHSPLIVDGATPVEQVAKRAMNRERFKIYDHIIITEEGAFFGVVSVQKMLDALARVQVEVAKGASPLTGMPGGVSLEKEIQRHCSGSRPISFIYVDLDNFKVFNDTYGFEQGDRMILLLGDILRWACRRYGDEDTFLGHVGGDDFVVISSPSQAERLCLAVTRCFTRLVRRLYTQEDLERGYIEGKGRDGHMGRFPLGSVSLGIVDTMGSCSLGQLGQRAAEVKRYAKSLEGSVFVRDRRTPLGDPENRAPLPEDEAVDHSVLAP